MPAKRALIVDDSKSARVVLSRMLERHELAVDTTESAESALAYLGAHRPDVIFMDHVMPGMDGLEAVQAIKRNPATAAIPILMYTSQDTDLYAGEARARGAAGVLAKQLAPLDISRALYDLQLLPDRRGQRASALEPVSLPLLSANDIVMPVPAAARHGAADAGEAAVAAAVAPAIATTAAGHASAAPPAAPTLGVEDVRGVVEPILQAQMADLRRFVVASLDSVTARVVHELHGRVVAVAPPAAAAAGAVISAEVAAAAGPPADLPTEPASTRRAPANRYALATLGGLAALGVGAVLATGLLAWQQHRELASLAARFAAQERTLAAERALLAAVPASAAPAAAGPARVAGDASNAGAAPAKGTAGTAGGTAGTAGAAATPGATAADTIAVLVPYGELPLAGSRLAALRSTLAVLEQRGFTGTLHVRVLAGDFCLTGNPAEGYALAPDDMPANRCDLIGNPRLAALRTGPGEPAAVALAAAVRRRTQGAISVSFAAPARPPTTTGYPTAPDTSAAQWNAAASAHNRVEFVTELWPATG